MNDYNERRGILDFVPPNFLKIPVLLIESVGLLAGLREILPTAQIAFMTEEPTLKIKKLCEEFRADLIDELPTAPKIFELIIAQDVLTTGENFYARLMAYNHLLKDSGALFTQFYNVRFVKVLEKLREGRFSNNERRFWAKADVVKLLDDAIYKEIHFLAGERDFSADEWEKFGFDNFSEDLTTKIWLVKACKCTAEVAALKDFFTLEVRADLSRILHRIEYDIDREKNLGLLMDICEREGIFDEYLSDFIEQVVIHESAKNFIKEWAKNFGRKLDFDCESDI
ncbi:MAG: methyltransferase [Selenomonadaceae bacterium]|nr:methyltransferase [Selenomonadaceae bacterium]